MSGRVLRIVGCKGFQIEVIGIDAESRFHMRPSDFCPRNGRLNRAHYSSCDFILEIEYIFQGAVDLVRPKMCTGNRLDELTSDTHPPARLAHATFQHITNAKFAPHLLYVHRPAFISETRIASDYK